MPIDQKSKAYIALIYVAIVWGTTYLAIKIGVEYFPPFLFAGMRQLLAGIGMFIMSFFIVKKRNYSLQNILFQSMIGVLLITLGNGFVTLGELWIPSGVAALICSMMPLFAVLFQRMFMKSEPINTKIILGMVLGVFGVAIIFKDNLSFLGDSKFYLGVLLTFIATASWSLGSILSKKRNEPSNPLFNAALQVSSGGLVLLLISKVTNENWQLQHIAPEGWYALLFLIVFGSLIAYTAYMYFLKVLPVGIAASYAYINPIVAVLCGWAWANESLSIYTLLAILFILFGVYLVNNAYKK